MGGEWGIDLSLFLGDTFHFLTFFLPGCRFQADGGFSLGALQA